MQLKSVLLKRNFNLGILAVFVLSGMTIGYLIVKSRASGAPQPKTTPYVRLFSELNNPGEAKTANTDQKVAELKTWYKHIHGEASNPNSFSLGNATKKDASDKTFAKRLAEAGVWSSQYRNGSYISQANSSDPLFSEAKDIEQNAPLAISSFWPGNYTPYDTGDNNAIGGRLQEAIPNGSDNITIRINSVSNKPAGSATTWPFINSKDTNSDGFSNSTADYISWIRIHNEIMQIVSNPVESNGVISFQVKRGIWGTSNANHDVSSRVLSPTYIGNSSSVASDGGLAGSPLVNDPNKALRYGIKIWKPEGYNWIANRIKSSFGTDLQGYNTVHLDVSSCNQYNNASADGKDIWNWDDDSFKKISRDQWGQYQKQKVAGLRTALPGIKFTGNNLFGATSAQNNSCTNDLLATAYDGGVFEHWMKYVGYSLDFASAMDQNYKVQTNNWPALYWVRWNYDFTGDVNQYKRFSYGALLLALRPTADKYQYGGLWGAGKPDPLYFYDFGNPKTNPQSLSEVSVSGQTDLYKRDFDNGFVLVNSGTSAKNYSLGTGEFYKVDVSGNPTSVSGQISVGAKDSVFVFGGSSTTTPPPTTLKKPMQGVLDRKGFPNSNYEEIVNGYVVDVDWKDLQPNSANDALSANNAIDKALSAVRQANANNPGRDMHLKIRLFTGDKSPNWAKQFAGGPVDYIEPQNNITATIPKFWSTEFRDAYNQLVEKIAQKYDDEEEIRDITISRCMTVFAETFIRGITNTTDRQNLVEAGFTPELDKQCHQEQIDAHTVFERTRSSLAFNPWQYIKVATMTVNIDVDFTNEMMTYCRSKLGQRCILENNSIRDSATTSDPLDSAHVAMYANMKALGPPILFQTSTESRIGDWRKTLEWAVSQGANAVELNSSYSNYNLIDLLGYDDQLEANPLDGTSNPPNNEVKTPTQVTATAGDASVLLKWQNENTLPVDYIVSYRKVSDSVWLWPGATTSMQYQFNNLVNNQNYEFRVRARYTDPGGNKTLSGDTSPVQATPQQTIVAKQGDINNDNKVDVFDLSILLSRWQRQGSDPADINQDGIVNVFDLSLLLSKWG